MDWDDEVERIRAFLAKQLEGAGADGYVVGISGGLDSSAAALLADEVSFVQPVFLPQADIQEETWEAVQLIAGKLDRVLETHPIGDAIGGIRGELDLGRIPDGNAQARIRMTFLYAIANEANFLVLGTANKSELMTGYFTKYGDGAVDINPLAHLYKTEVRELARHIGVPEDIIERTPTAGLWKGQTDEGELGMSYEKIDAALKVSSVNEEADTDVLEDLTQEEFERVGEMTRRSRHKREMPPSLSRGVQHD